MSKRMLLSEIHRVAADRPAGYVQDILECGTVSGDFVTLTDDDYKRLARKYRRESPSQSGPGTELKALLKSIGITASSSCPCNERAAHLDRMGCDWAESNIDEIVSWLRESAAERGLPFLDAAGRLLVKRAIANARRKAAADAQRPPHHDRGEAVAPPVHETEG